MKRIGLENKLITYLILFTFLGAVTTYAVKESKTVFVVFGAIAILWGISHQIIWGFVTFGELSLGYFIVSIFLKSKEL